MTVTIRGSSPATSGIVNTATISVTLNGTRQPQAGDLLVIIHANNWYGFGDMPTPTVGGSSTGVNAITNGSVDGGANLGHIKSYTYVVSATGDVTVAVTETSGNPDEEKHLVVYVLAGADTTDPISGGSAGAATSSNSANSTSHVLTGVTPDKAGTLLIGHDSTGGASGWTTGYTTPGTEAYDFNDAAFASACGWTEQLTAAGATGTRTVTAAVTCNTYGLILAINPELRPTLVSTGLFGSNWTATTSPQTAAPAVQVGDLLVVAAIGASGFETFGTPTGGTGLSWTTRQSDGLAGTRSWVTLFTAPVVTSETPTLSITQSGGTDPWGARWWLFRNHGGVGASAIDKTDTDDATVAITTTAVDSTIVAVVGDWAARNEAGTWSGLAGAVQTDNDFVFDSGFYTVHVATFDGTGAIGAKTITLATPTAMQPTIAALEVLPPAGFAAADVLTWDIVVRRE